MRSTLRPSPAMVIALIALFVALGGSAAALSGSNTVQSDDLGPGAQVGPADLQDGAVRSRHVLDNSLRGDADIAASSIPDSALAPNVGRLRDIRLGGAVNTDRFQVISNNLSIYTSCFTPSFGGDKLVQFLNRSQANATLNWFFSNGTTVAANGVVLGPPDSGSEARSFSFAGGRIEGQFIFATSNEMTTVNLHTFDAGNRCEVHGTAQVKVG
jgi:hypothetical protein